MSAMVNLLPPEIIQRRRTRHEAGVAAAALILFAAMLGGLYLLKLSDVGQTRAERDATQAVVDRLQVEVASLAEARTMAADLEARNALLATAMREEISWSRVLNDLAIAFPADASLLTLTATQGPVGGDQAAAAPALPPADTAAPAAPALTAGAGSTVAFIAFTGYSTREYAPGVAKVLDDLENVAAFRTPTLGTAAAEQRGDTQVTTFAGAVDVTTKAYTRRYDDGLPAELTP